MCVWAVALCETCAFLYDTSLGSRGGRESVTARSTAVVFGFAQGSGRNFGNKRENNEIVLFVFFVEN